MISRLNEGQCLEISKWCINSILEHSIHEKGLFRLSPSMNDIRRVKQQLSEGNSLIILVVVIVIVVGVTIILILLLFI